MAKSKTGTDPRKYAHFQFGFRVKDKATLEALRNELKALYEKFNKGRDPMDPQGVRAVKVSDIVLKAINIGLQDIRKMKTWTFEE